MSPGKTETVISKCTEDIGSEKSEISNRSVSSELMKSSTAAEIPLQTRPDIGLVSPGNGRGTRRDCVNIAEGLGCAAAAPRISAARDGNHTARNLHRRSLRFRNHHARDRRAANPGRYRDAARRVHECARLCREHHRAGNFLARALVVEPTLRPLRWDLD